MTLIDNAGSDKNKLVISLLYDSGSRIRELCNIKGSDITWETRMMLIRKGKGGKYRRIPVSRDLCDDL